jgi:transcription elongation GreA/GreB family factor
MKPLAFGLALLLMLLAGCARVEIHPALLDGAEFSALQERVEALGGRVEQLEARLRAAAAPDAAPPGSAGR